MVFVRNNGSPSYPYFIPSEYTVIYPIQSWILVLPTPEFVLSVTVLSVTVLSVTVLSVTVFFLTRFHCSYFRETKTSRIEWGGGGGGGVERLFVSQNISMYSLYGPV